LAELAKIAIGWPLALSLAALVTAQGLLAGRRRMALNEALHELRRPLQALVLCLPLAPGAGAQLSRQTAAALERLEREINGEAAVSAAERVEVVALAAATVVRWRPAADRAGSRLELVEADAEAWVAAERDGIERALDNLVVNAVEHGGPRVRVAVERGDGSVRISVTDEGSRAWRGAFLHAPSTKAPRLLAAIARLSGRRRRGHGLRVVRRVAAEHGGELSLRRRGAGTVATLRLPLPQGEGEG
jgi:signal transduction histidine kinase